MGDDELTRRAKTRVGATLRGKWRLDELLGVGGMASVYAGTHRNGLRGAVKVLHLELSTDAEMRERFLREGYVANRVGHPGAVRVLDDDVSEDGAVFLVMELLEGWTVAELAASSANEVLDIPLVLSIGDQLLDVLAAAHDKGILHRDIKPENLFMTSGGEVKVLDFGIARMRDLPASSSRTKTGRMMGTPAFMAPEQALGNWSEVDARTDVFSVGATLFCLLTGRVVHDGESMNKALLSAMTQPAPPLLSVRSDLPRALAAIVDRSLAFAVSDRYGDARTMQAELRALAGMTEAFEDEPTAENAAIPGLGAPASSARAAFGPTAAPVTRDSVQAPGPARRFPIGFAVAGAVFVCAATASWLIFNTRTAPMPEAASANASTIEPAVAPPQVQEPSAKVEVSPVGSAQPPAPDDTGMPVLDVDDLPTVPQTPTIGSSRAAPNRRAAPAIAEPKPSATSAPAYHGF